MSTIAASYNNASSYCSCECHAMHACIYPPICRCECFPIKKYTFINLGKKAEMIEANKEKENVHHPKHYINGKSICAACGSPIECIDVTRHLNFNIGNAMKYLWRHEHKNNAIEDLKKAVWYILDEISQLEKDKNEPVL